MSQTTSPTKCQGDRKIPAAPFAEGPPMVVGGPAGLPVLCATHLPRDFSLTMPGTWDILFHVP